MSFAANPRANNPQEGDRETTGQVTSDSLAAESIRADGGFAENNAAISSVKGSNSTLANTDTSGASTLPPARSGAERSDESSTTQYPDTNPKFSGIHSPEGYVGGPSSTSTSTSSHKESGVTGDSFAPNATTSSSTSGNEPDPNIRSGSAVKPSGANTSSGSGYRSSETDNPIATGRAGEDFGTAKQPEKDTAPNYAATVSGAIQREGEGQPKGENLTEGGIPETKTFTGNVGGSKDPGRLAEKDFDKMGDGSVSAAGEKQHSGESSSGGAFDVLSSEKI